MKTITKGILLAAGLALSLSVVFAQQNQGILSWAPKPIKPTGWVPPQKPVTKLADVLAAHKGQQTWRQAVVADDYLHAEYISMAPGEKVGRRFHPDTREWWVVQDGEIRFSIEGQPPFVAKKGFLVQVPFRTIYSMETVGDKPSLRFEVNIANAKTMYPIDDKPPQIEGITFVPVRITASKGKYDKTNRPYFDFDKDIAAKLEATPKHAGTVRFIDDDRAVSNAIYGYAKDLPPVTDADKGHFHEECAEFWFILAGQIEYKMENMPAFVADQGDVVYAPKLTWHRPRFSGDGPSCRLAMNGYPDIGHLYQASELSTH